MDRQLLLEREVIGIGMFKFELVSKVKKEDFVYYSDIWQIVEESKGYSIDLLKKYPNAYKFADNTAYTQFSIEKMLSELFLSTFTRFLDKTYTYYLKTSKNALEAFKVSEIKKEVNSQDVLDLIENLPAYFELNGLNTKKISGWSTYCKKRLENGI